MDYSTMEAGREMDALIAEKVMGWKKLKNATFWMPNFSEGMLRYCDNGVDIPKFSALYSPFHPSRSIVAAWEVVEKMEEKDMWFSMGNVIPNSDPIVYEVRFFGSGKNGYACEGSMPLAICRAALMAQKEG